MAKQRIEPPVEPSAEMQRLAAIVGTDSPKPEPEETNKDDAIPHPPYDQVPYLNNEITFKDREAELALLIQLLDYRKKKAVEELYYVQNCRDHRYYPDIVHQDPNTAQ